MGCEKIENIAFYGQEKSCPKSRPWTGSNWGRGKRQLKHALQIVILTYIVILSSSDETRQGSLIPGTLFPLQLQKVTKCNLAKITLYRHESAVQKVGNAESSTF